MTQQLEFSPMEKALNEFQTWLQDNKINLNNISSNNTSRQNINANDKPYQSIDIMKKLHNYISVAEKFVQDISPDSTIDINYIDVNQKFGDLVKKESKSAVEQKLIKAVEELLPPQEKQNAINQNKTVGNVIEQVNQSINKFQENLTEIIMQHQKEEKDKKQHKEQEVMPKEKMQSLGEAFGILDAIVKSIKQHSLVEKVSTQSIKSSNIPTNPKNNPQQRTR